MNAYLFAAGNGMRLRPKTDEIQKCLLPVGGRPMLEWWINAVFASECFDEIFVNVHYLADQVEEWIGRYCKRTGRKISIIDERKSLLGTASTLFFHAEVGAEFMSVYTDTFSFYTIQNLPHIISGWEMAKKTRGIIAGILSFENPNDGSTGNFKMRNDGTVSSFAEKSESGDLAWSGVLFGGSAFHDFLSKDDRDLARDVLPKLSGRMAVVAHVDAYDIGRGIDKYEQFNSTFHKRGTLATV